MTLQFYYEVYTEENWKHRSSQKFVHKCSWQHYSLWPKGGYNPNAYQLMNGETKCSSSIRITLFGNKKEWNTDSCYKNEPGKHYAKWNKPKYKEHTVYDST